MQAELILNGKTYKNCNLISSVLKDGIFSIEIDTEEITRRAETLPPYYKRFSDEELRRMQIIISRPIARHCFSKRLNDALMVFCDKNIAKKNLTLVSIFKTGYGELNYLEEILMIPNTGKKTIEEFQKFLEKHNLEIKMPIKELVNIPLNN
jgi:hypothetical protein